jgi:hypothetical protein
LSAYQSPARSAQKKNPDPITGQAGMSMCACVPVLLATPVGRLAFIAPLQARKIRFRGSDSLCHMMFGAHQENSHNGQILLAVDKVQEDSWLRLNRLENYSLRAFHHGQSWSASMSILQQQ